MHNGEMPSGQRKAPVWQCYLSSAFAYSTYAVRCAKSRRLTAGGGDLIPLLRASIRRRLAVQSLGIPGIFEWRGQL